MLKLCMSTNVAQRHHARVVWMHSQFGREFRCRGWLHRIVLQSDEQSSRNHMLVATAFWNTDAFYMLLQTTLIGNSVQ